MGIIINIDEALKQRSRYNVLREPLNDLLVARQEAWEKENPIDLIYKRGTLSGFQETYTSNIGFDHAFAETSDYAVAPIFNTAEGFSATYRSRTFQGGFIITQQTLEDGQYGKVKDDASAFMKRWHGDIVEYALKCLDGGFGEAVEWGDEKRGGVSVLKMNSADTVDGTLDGVKNPLFTKNHTIVKRKGMTSDDITAAKQSNCFYGGITLGGDDSAQIPKLADLINQVITIMENYKDDNGKYAGVDGQKEIVACNNPRLKAAIDTALAMDQFKMGESMFLNPGYKRAVAHYTPYLNDINATKDGAGFFIIDRAYNNENHGPEFTERIPLTLNATETKNPYGITYDGRQRFDINCASWRGIAYVYVGTPSDTTNFTQITVGSAISTPVTVVNTVKTKEQS